MTSQIGLGTKARGEVVLARYRELKAGEMEGLEASRVVLRETLEGAELSPSDVPVLADVPTENVPTRCNVPGCIREREKGRKICGACRKQRQRE